jgi:hypothetical protein
VEGGSPTQKAGVRERERDGVPWLEVAGDGWRVVFSTREGGVSTGHRASLNLGYSVGDDPEAVAENRRRFTRAVGVGGADLVVPGQVHGTHIAVVGPDERGRGASDRGTVIHDTDALMTDQPGVPLVVTFADCVPVLVVGRHHRRRTRIALVHAGWRGMLAGIVHKAALMVSAHEAAETAAREGDLVAAVIGPSIGPCCFTVDRGVGEKFAHTFPGTYAPAHGGGEDRRGRPTPSGRVDLWLAAERQLTAAGLEPSHIVNLRLCTSCDPRFYSHRRDEGLTGRQAAIAWIEGERAREGRTRG